jgi:hypothetical protein
MASICSVTTIVPSSAALFAPTATDHERGEQGADLAERAETGAPPDETLRLVARDEGRCLDDHDRAGEERGDGHDGERLHPHLVEIHLELARVEAEPHEPREDLPEQDAEAADELADAEKPRAGGVRDAAFVVGRRFENCATGHGRRRYHEAPDSDDRARQRAPALRSAS